MSCRWDSLKPRNSNNKKEARGAQTSPPDGHAAAHHQNQHPPRNNRGKWQPSTKRNGASIRFLGNNTSDVADNHTVGFDRRKTPWRKSSSINSNTTAEKGGTTQSDSLLQWSNLVDNLREWGKSPNCRKNEKEDVKAASTRDGESLRGILQEMALLLEQSNERSIAGTDRGNALVASLSALSKTQEIHLVGDVLAWSNQLFALAEQHSLRGGLRMTMTTLQAQQSITGLINVQRCADHDQANTQVKYYQCCTNLLINFVSQLPAEETAHQMVGGVILPVLERLLFSPMASTEKSREGMNGKSLLLQGIQTLQALLTEKSHASALLAPLVKDVGSDGHELHLVNPLRRRIFRVLQYGAEEPSQLIPTTTAQQMHTCLTLALQMTLVVGKSLSVPPTRQQKGSAAGTKKHADLDSLVMETFFITKICYPDNRIQLLEMLEVYLATQPSASLSLGTALLLHETPRKSAVTVAETSATCPTCNCPKLTSSSIFPPFLALLHNSESQSESSLAISSLATLVSNIPWNLWMGKKSPQFNHRQNSSVSNFSLRVLDAIQKIVQVSRCLLVSRWKSNSGTENLAGLVRAILLNIPFESCDGNSSQGQGVEKAAFEMVDTLASKLLQSKSRKYALVDSMTELFEESMGGRLTPQGSRTLMIAPVSSWLISPSSQVFLNRAFHDISEEAKASTLESVASSKITTKLLCSIFFSGPKIVLNNNKYWITFEDSVRLLCSSKNSTLQQNGLQLLESLLQGRRITFEENKSKEVVHLALSILPTAAASGLCRTLSFQAYGSLLGSDWLKYTDEKQIDCMEHHLRMILSHCSGSGRTTSARSAACKAVGDICSNCFLVENQNGRVSLDSKEHILREDYLRQIGDDVCRAMLQSMEDGNGAIRSMAIFTVGNLAQAIGSCNYQTFLDPFLLQKVCLAVNGCLQDENDKVSSNAIRSIGHLTVLLLDESYRVSLVAVPWNVDLFCQNVVLAMSEKVSSVPTVLSNSCGARLSWKQRSNIKKHGRIACNSLALMLQNLRISDMAAHDGVVPCQTALKSIFKCVNCLGTTLDEKVIVAAILASRALPSSSLARVSGKSGLVGKTIVSCISFLAKERWSKGVYAVSSGKLLIQVDLLCEHLIDSAAIVDATIVLNYGDIADSWVEQLYKWMVFKGCSARAFGVFALALQTPSIRLPVTVEQKFAIRATNLLRNEDLANDSDDEL